MISINGQAYMITQCVTAVSYEDAIGNNAIKPPNLSSSQFWDQLSKKQQSIAQVHGLAELETAIRSVEDFGKLKPNWDGYGAVVFSKDAIDYTLKAITFLTRSEFANLAAPEITPETNGTVSMTWTNGNTTAYLEIGKTRYAGYIQIAETVPSFLEGSVKTLNDRSTSNPFYSIQNRLAMCPDSIP